MEKLKFGCVVKYKGYYLRLFEDFGNPYWFTGGDGIYELYKEHFEIIGILSERHVRLYLFKNKMYVHQGGNISFINYCVYVLNILDITKSFDSQTEEIYKNISNF